jgi:hypothetical protein
MLLTDSDSDSDIMVGLYSVVSVLLGRQHGVMLSFLNRVETREFGTELTNERLQTEITHIFNVHFLSTPVDDQSVL